MPIRDDGDDRSSVDRDRLCPVCSCPRKSCLYRQDFHSRDIALMSGYDVVVCEACGFLYADKIPAQADFDRYYASMSKYEFNDQGGIASDDHMERYTRTVDFLLPYLKDRGMKIADIGCSTGGVLSLLKAKGYDDLLGVDPSGVCAGMVQELYGIKAFTGGLFDLVVDEKFDLIILSAVLEHLVDLRSAMQRVSALLKDGGLLFVDVPDVDRFDAHVMAPFQQFSIEHINYFSQRSLANLLGAFSFELIDAREQESRQNWAIDPDLFVLARKSVAEKAGMVRDIAGGIKMDSYISRSREIDRELRKVLGERLLNKGELIVWGVGTHTQRLLGAGLDPSKVLFFVDSNKRYAGRSLNGIPIKGPQDIGSAKAPILISTHAYQQEIAQQIREVLGLDNEIITMY